MRSSGSWWASRSGASDRERDRRGGRWLRTKVRQFRSHRSALVRPAEVAELATWTTPGQRALFRTMHVADQRHGLDVVASLRAAGRTDPDLLLAGLLHDAGKGQTGVWPRVAWSLGEAYGSWVWRVAGILPGMRRSLARLRDHAERSAELAQAAGCAAADRRPDPPPGGTARPRPRRGAAARGRGQLMLRSAARRRPEGSDRRRRSRPPALTSTDASIRFADARAPERATLVELDGFDGPLALLLSLIEARRLDVLTVPLGALAGAYLEALATLPGDRLVHVSAFVAVASQLILIKSRALLPRRWEAVGPGLGVMRPTPRRSSARGCCCTGRTATPDGDWRSPRPGAACSGASRRSRRQPGERARDPGPCRRWIRRGCAMPSSGRPRSCRRRRPRPRSSRAS